jgi:PBSX family phage terminase large subunit
LIKLHQHQSQAFSSKKRIIVCSAGIQSGKTFLGALWLGFKFAQYSSETDNFIIAAPTYKILNQATLPHFLRLWGHLGEYKKGDSEFKIYGGGTVYMRTATEENSIEGITNVRGIWLDEGGMVGRAFWENIEGRSAVKQAQIIVTTTPYALNWLYDMWKDVNNNRRDDVEFLQFRSIDNPYFPKEEFERQKRLLDPRRFEMKYMGVFGKMQGLVYEDVPLIESFELPSGTQYYAGIDWGYNDPFVIVIRAITPAGIHYRVGEFYKTNMLIQNMMEAIRARHAQYKFKMCFCDPSRPEYIQQINAYGVPAIGGNNSIRLGIDRHIELMRSNKFYVFSDRNPVGIDEYNTYHYPEPEEVGIDDDSKDQLPVDANNHGLDAERYVTMGTWKVEKETKEAFNDILHGRELKVKRKTQFEQVN